jgi:deazaflavin-dependent oxidoreductase (nitroreductase family)
VGDTLANGPHSDWTTEHRIAEDERNPPPEVNMRTRTTGLLGVPLLILAALAAVFILGMRTKNPSVLGCIRRMNRAFWNPRTMESAGTPGAYASIVRHVGRTSGRDYETPVGAVATDDGFVIALPYGSQADWLKNVLASGRAVIVDEGVTYEVDQPEIIGSDEAAIHFAPQELRAQRLFGVDQSLRVRRAADVS